jgi:hypothetical protein
MRKDLRVIKTLLLLASIICVLTSCNNGSGESSNSDSINSITPPPTKDTASAIAPMMGDTSKTEVDSLKMP